MYGLIDVIDYIKSCLFSKHGLYVANKVNLEVSEIDGKRFPTFTISPMPMNTGDVVSKVPEGVVSSNVFCVKGKSTEPYFWDEENDIIYILYAKIYYDKDGCMNCSVIDKKIQEKKKPDIALECCSKMLLKRYPDGKGFNRGNITWRFPSDFNVIKYVE